MTQPTAARKPLPPHIVMLVGVLFLLAHVPSVIAQQLWSHSEAGMSVDEVRAKFPEANEPENPAKLADGRTASSRPRIRSVLAAQGALTFFLDLKGQIPPIAHIAVTNRVCYPVLRR